MLAFGLASVPFFRSLYVQYNLYFINLPKTKSNSPLIISPQDKNKMGYGGASGPHSPSKPQKVINSLGSKRNPHVVKNADVTRVLLQNADLEEIEIENSDFSYANLRKVNFSKASIIYSSFISVNFKNADFRGAKLFGSDLTNADFSNANFTRANFAHSDFSNANLTNSDLTDTNLSNASLQSVKGLTYKQLRKALINEHTTLPTSMESKRDTLFKRSQQRMKELNKKMSFKELELFSNEFDFLD